MLRIYRYLLCFHSMDYHNASDFPFHLPVHPPWSVVTLTNFALASLSRLALPLLPSPVSPSSSVATLLRPRPRPLRSLLSSSRESVVFRRNPVSLRPDVSSRSGMSLHENVTALFSWDHEKIHSSALSNKIRTILESIYIIW